MTPFTASVVVSKYTVMFSLLAGVNPAGVIAHMSVVNEPNRTTLLKLFMISSVIRVRRRLYNTPKVAGDLKEMTAYTSTGELIAL